MKTYTLTETAKLIRQELKTVFGTATKFSVRSKSYSMGCSINVFWTDGPTAKEVDLILDNFEGSTFDGMTDLRSSQTQIYNGEEADFEPDYVFSNRTESAELRDTVQALLTERYPQIVQEGHFDGYSWYPNNGQWTSGIEWDRVYRRAMYHFDASTGQFIFTDLLNGYEPDNWQYHPNPEPEPQLVYTPEPVAEPAPIIPLAIAKPKSDVFVEANFAICNKRNRVSDYQQEIEQGGCFYRRERCKIAKIVSLSPDDFDRYADNLLESYPWIDGEGGTSSDADQRKVEQIWEYTDEEMAEWRAHSLTLVVAVTALGRPTVYANPEGYSYTRYLGL